MAKLYFVYGFHDVEFTPTDEGYRFDCVRCYQEVEVREHHQVEIDANGAITVTPMVICPNCGHTIWIDGSLGIDIRRKPNVITKDSTSKIKSMLRFFTWGKKKPAHGT